ncbi:unnamed protein product, partial [Ectocarpus sp. 12 AP-2014]
PGQPLSLQGQSKSSAKHHSIPTPQKKKTGRPPTGATHLRYLQQCRRRQPREPAQQGGRVRQAKPLFRDLSPAKSSQELRRGGDAEVRQVRPEQPVFPARRSCFPVTAASSLSLPLVPSPLAAVEISPQSGQVLRTPFPSNGRRARCFRAGAGAAIAVEAQRREKDVEAH